MKIRVESPTSYRGRNSRPNLPVLGVFVLLALAVGAIGAVFSPALSSSAAQWYAALAKPDWVPLPKWFGPVWAALYVSMAVAAWMIWRERYHSGRAMALVAYTAQLLLNALFAPTFFGMKSIGGALFVVIALWIAVAWTLREFARVRAAAAIILVPYLLWISFAAAVTLRVWRLNS
jgi:tryptophan-rich sensory protein